MPTSVASYPTPPGLPGGLLGLSGCDEQSLPKIGILRDKTWIKGANNLNDKVPMLVQASFLEAMTRAWDTDAHFICYRPVDAGMDDFPRLNKAILPKLLAAGARVLLRYMVLDVDNPGHLPWTFEQMRAFYARVFESDPAEFPFIDEWAAFYVTRNGARFVFALDTDLEPAEFEGKHQGLCQHFLSHGINADIQVSDWTRCFRLPYVVRDQRASWEEPVFNHIIIQPNKRLCAADLPMSGKQRTMAAVADQVYADIQPLDWPKPDDATARALMTVMGEGRIKQSEWYKSAKQRLKRRDCYPALFEYAPLADKGYRDATLHRYVGQVIAVMFRVSGTTPDHIYGLFLDAVLQLEADEQTPDWTVPLWGAISRCWAKEEAKVKAQAQQAEQAEADGVAKCHGILEGMRSWCSHPKLHGDDSVAIEWLLSHLIISVGPNYYVMSPDGYYYATPLGPHQVIAQIRKLGMDNLIETLKTNEDNTPTDVPLTQIIGRYATVVGEVEAAPETDGVIVRDIDTPSATVIIPSYGRNTNLTPTYDTDVDEWLQVLFGSMYERVCEWVAWSLAWDEGPICALSIQGGAGIGKKLFTRGLAECLRVPRVATAADLIGNYQYGLIQSPFLVVNEGWPARSAVHPADQFRALVGGDPFIVNRRYLHPVTVKSPVRIIFTANNQDVVRMLAADRNLSPSDRDALAVRLMHLQVRDDAAVWLRNKGGLMFTARPGRRWIANDAGIESDYVVARHFLWLYHNFPSRQAKRAPGNRLLIEGDCHDELMFLMRTQSGAAPLVIEAVIKMIESGVKYKGLVIDQRRIFALTSEVVDYYRTRMKASAGRVLRVQDVASVFEGLVVDSPDERSSGSIEIAAAPDMGRRRWYELDPKMLLLVAERDGWPCTKLRAIVTGMVQADLSRPSVKSLLKPLDKLKALGTLQQNGSK